MQRQLPSALVRFVSIPQVKAALDSSSSSKKASVTPSRAWLRYGHFTGAAGEVFISRRDANRKEHKKGADVTLFVGVGKRVDLPSIRAPCVTAMRQLGKLKPRHATIAFPGRVLPTAADSSLTALVREDWRKKQKAPRRLSASEQRQLVTWCETALYKYDAASNCSGSTTKQTAQKETTSKGSSSNKEDETPPQPKWIPALKYQRVAPSAVREARAIADAVNTARTMGNLRPDVGNPAHYAAMATSLAKRLKATGAPVRIVNVLNQHQLKRKGLNLMSSVGQAATSSAHTPRLVVLEYIGNPKKKTATALVGKGVTMDTGGLNIKAFGSMEQMHMDMMGAATVHAAFAAIVALRLPVNVVATMAYVENACGSKAVRPSTIVKSLKGSTVEITNTDAEGRLILADAFTFVQRHAKLRKPVDTLIDVATLTGAICVALGNERAGMFSNDRQLAQSLMKAGDRTDEPLWPMPIGPEHHKAMKGTLSDLNNCAPGRFGGACSAAAFLQHFVEKDTKWAHLDVAGPAMGEKETEKQPAGVPGFGVQLLVDFFSNNQL